MATVPATAVPLAREVRARLVIGIAGLIAATAFAVFLQITGVFR